MGAPGVRSNVLIDQDETLVPEWMVHSSRNSGEVASFCRLTEVCTENNISLACSRVLLGHKNTLGS